MRHTLSIGLGLALFGSAPPALAHAELRRAMPQPGSVVSTSPPEVRLQFSEGIEGRFSGLDVVASNGAGSPSAAPKCKGLLWWSRSPSLCPPACIA